MKGELIERIHYEQNKIESEIYRNQLGLDVKLNYDINGNLITETYKLNGEFHNFNDDPAFISYYTNGAIKEKMYYINGKLNRITRDNPSVIAYYYNGFIKEKSFYIEDKLSRENKNDPVIISYYANSKIKQEHFILNNNKHFDSVINRYYLSNESLVSKEFYKDGELHNSKGEPAKIEYYLNGDIKESYYYLNGVKLNEFEYLVRCSLDI